MTGRISWVLITMVMWKETDLSSKPNLNDTNVLWQNAVGTGWSGVSGNKVFLHDRTGNKGG